MSNHSLQERICSHTIHFTLPGDMIVICGIGSLRATQFHGRAWHKRNATETRPAMDGREHCATSEHVPRAGALARHFAIFSTLYLVAYLAASYLDLYTTRLALQRPGTSEGNVYATNQSSYSSAKAWVITGLGLLFIEGFLVYSLLSARHIAKHWIRHPLRSFGKLYINPWSKRIRGPVGTAHVELRDYVRASEAAGRGEQPVDPLLWDRTASPNGRNRVQPYVTGDRLLVGSGTAVLPARVCVLATGCSAYQTVSAGCRRRQRGGRENRLWFAKCEDCTLSMESRGDIRMHGKVLLRAAIMGCCIAATHCWAQSDETLGGVASHQRLARKRFGNHPAVGRRSQLQMPCGPRIPWRRHDAEYRGKAVLFYDMATGPKIENVYCLQHHA